MVSAPTISVHRSWSGRRPHWIAGIVLLLAGCPRPDGPAEPAEPPPDADLVAIAGDCIALLQEYSEVDMARVGEAELQRQMDEALLNEELCGQALREAYRGTGGQPMANHLARSLTVHALQAELALSARFDEMEGYCAILVDLVELLNAELEELEVALTATPPPDDADGQALVPLYQLTLQSLQVSVLDYGQTCR